MSNEACLRPSSMSLVLDPERRSDGLRQSLKKEPQEQAGVETLRLCNRRAGVGVHVDRALREFQDDDTQKCR
jgi:hypothetical protein